MKFSLLCLEDKRNDFVFFLVDAKLMDLNDLHVLDLCKYIEGVYSSCIRVAGDL